MPTAQEMNIKGLMTVAEFCELAGYKETRIRDCIRATKVINGWPPLRAKRMPDGQLRITGDAAAEWITAMRDA